MTERERERERQITSGGIMNSTEQKGGQTRRQSGLEQKEAILNVLAPLFSHQRS